MKRISANAVGALPRDAQDGEVGEARKDAVREHAQRIVVKEEAREVSGARKEVEREVREGICAEV